MSTDRRSTSCSSTGSIYPDVGSQERLARLVGVDDQKCGLAKILGLLVNLAGLESWAKEISPGANNLVNSVLNRPPLVGAGGRCWLPASPSSPRRIGDAVARQEKIDITLFPMSPLDTRAGASR